MRRESVIFFFLVGKKNLYIFILPLLLRNLYLKQTGNTARSRRSVQTAGRFPESRSAESEAQVRWLAKGRDREDRAGGDGTYQGRVQHGTPDEAQVKVKPGQGTGAEGLLTALTPAPAHKKPRESWGIGKLGGITHDPHCQSLKPPSCFGQMGMLEMKKKWSPF